MIYEFLDDSTRGLIINFFDVGAIFNARIQDNDDVSITTLYNGGPGFQPPNDIFFEKIITKSTKETSPLFKEYLIKSRDYKLKSII